mmetsp:Transcript_39665/g.55247  ORF Transcript_39665/g.55247 Transcript_39665/m.55247 type:complete len:206 (+) Transcript_39665:15-632(+)
MDEEKGREETKGEEEEVDDKKKEKGKNDSQYRFVFISASRFFLEWKKVPPEVLKQSLFFFGSKKTWVFPKTEIHRKDAERQPGPYPEMWRNKDFMSLLKSKDKNGEVYFLKRDDLPYQSYPGPKDPEAFPRASKWFESLSFNPLILDVQWWIEKGDGSKDFRYERSVKRIIGNFTGGFHEYDEVKELIYQSNPSLTPLRSIHDRI